MTQQVRHVHLGDTRTVLDFELVQPNELGVDTPVPLTGLTAKFKMVTKHGKVIIPLTTTGCTITDAAAGEVEYDFSSSGVDQAGEYFGYVVIDDGGETDHFPVIKQEFKIIVHAD